MILIAPTAFKGTLSAATVADAMAAGARAVTVVPLHVQPLSDGGPGLIDAMSVLGDTELHRVRVRGPLDSDVDARILLRSKTAIVESADACGLHLVPPERRDPTVLHTRGVGELMRAASEFNVERIVVGLGGSATVDGGIGMREAIGGTPLRIAVLALADVATPLVDAARVFGPQKGATPAQVTRLEQELTRLMEQAGIPDFPGAGAAGGLAYGLRAFVNAEVVSGSDWVLEQTGITHMLAAAHVVVSGEGEFDEQSFMGKITGTLVQRAQTRRVPILIVTGKSTRAGGYEHVAHNHGALLSTADIERLVREHLPALLRS
jgi:glycerate kinase